SCCDQRLYTQPQTAVIRIAQARARIQPSSHRHRRGAGTRAVWLESWTAMSMKACCVFAATFLLCAKLPEAPPATQDAPAADAAPQISASASAASGSSTASWSGKHSNGTLSFNSAECTLMNDRIIFFTAPAGAEENVYPQMSGTHTRDAAWVVNIL